MAAFLPLVLEEEEEVVITSFTLCETAQTDDKKDPALKTLTSLNKVVRPVCLSDNSIWSFPSVSSLSDYSIWRS